ncbi:alpha/beta-hydrolase [Myriangium duriaei CBS 260.36]|uniref:Alpha/beta-hydrolase n=1 Tax=Myriangium duriaei CBS 260.36 TaxID=1168546 RepID=A0A9P4J534_9PEZI|nr:alpha/beta-hydrolase [Myriangium duriaei CBS 260.36]
MTENPSQQGSTPKSDQSCVENVPPEFLKYPPPDNCRILVLPDGRNLSYAEYGSKAANASTFIFIHGIPDTRLDACLLSSNEVLAQKLNIRWIGIDRPGIGFSTFQETRTVLGWVEDLKCLIKELKPETYWILSVSGGTPYALACALLLPQSELKSVGIGFGVGPWEAGMAGLCLLNRIGLWIWKNHPWIFRWLFDKYVVPKVYQSSPVDTRKMIEQQNKYMTKEDREALQDPELMQGLVNIEREIYRQGSSRGYIEDSKMATRDWGFKLEDVQYPGIRLWYGDKDVNTPSQAGRYMAERLQHAVFKEYPGKSHFTMWDCLEDMLSDMLQDG